MARRRWVSIAATVASALVLSACWPVPGQNADRTAHNGLETALTPATVGGLNQLWASDPVQGRLRDPVVAGGGVVASTGGVVHRFRGATGELDWSWHPGEEPSDFVAVGDPFVVGDSLLVGHGYGNLGGHWQAALLDIATGTPTGQVDDGALTESVRGTLAASTYYAFGSGTPVLVGYNLADVETGAVDSARLAIADTGGPAPSALTLGTERLYQAGSGVLAPAAPGEQQRFGLGVRAFPRSGVTSTCGPDLAASFACPLWATEVGGTPTAPVIGPGEQVVYVGTGAGTVVALDPATGTVLWTVPVGAAVVHPPALAGGVLYVPTNAGDVVAVDASGCGAATCDPLWTASTGTAAVAAQPAVAGTGADAVLYAGTAGGDLHAFAAAGCGEAACAPLWSAATGSPVTGGPIVSNGRVYAGLQDGRMVAYGLTAG
jgi:outer membrane protein assembly factor BamB